MLTFRRPPRSPERNARPAPPPARLGVGAWVAIAFGVVLVLFSVAELAKGRWLLGAPMAHIGAFRHLVGLAISLIAALVAAWLVLRGTPSLFSVDMDSDEAATAGRPATDDDREGRFAVWFIRMRWVAVLTAALLVFVAVKVTGYLAPELGRPLALAIGTLVGLNIAYTTLLRAGAAPGPLLKVQAYGDLVMLTVLLHFSGGIENPLTTVLSFHVIIAGMIFERRQSYYVAAAASALFTLLALGEFVGVLAHYPLAIFPNLAAGGVVTQAAFDGPFVFSHIALHVGMLFLTAYFASTVADQLRRGRRRVERLADRALSQSQLLERALETTGTALCVCDRDARPMWHNPRWGELFGRECLAPRGEALRQEAPTCQTLLDEGQRIREVCVPAHDAVGGAPAGRGERTFLLTTAPLVDARGAITHVVQLAREITEQKAIQARVARTERLVAIGELAGRVAHEVNNPVAIISAKSRLLLSDHREALSSHTADELGKIAELSDRIARITQGLLSYCRPSVGSAKPVDLRSVVRKSLAMVEPSARVAGVMVDDRLPADLPPVRVNAGEVGQVFLNLFVNALDAMPRGGRLSVSTLNDRGAGHGTGLLHVVVADTGSGIPADIRERIFEPFLTTKPDGQGTGLGLSICLGLVRGNNGTIEIESEPDRGTRVILGFPLAGAVAVAEARAGAA